MNNMAEYFPILKYKNGRLTRINGSKSIMPGKYALLPLFSTDPDEFCNIDTDARIEINGKREKVRVGSIAIIDKSFSDLPDPCFLVAKRYAFSYTVEEVESLNKIWDKLMSELKNEG